MRVRQSDETSGLTKYKHKAKEAVQDKREELQEQLEDFREKSPGDKAKTVASFAGRKLVGQIPFASSALSAGDVVNSHLQMQEAQEVAEEDAAGDVMSSLATGESRYYQRQRNRQGIESATSAVSSAVGLVTGGTLASVAKTGGAAAANFVGGQISDRLVDGETDLPELRMQMHRSSLNREDEVERGNTSLALAGQDPNAAHAMLRHLNRPPLTFQQEFALNQRHQEQWRPSTLERGQSGVDRQHTLLPSQVERVGKAETSRVRLQQQEQARLARLQQIGNTTLIGRGMNAWRNRAANRQAQPPQAIPLQPMNAPL